jgi:glycosyltransferase involved in cell wall biosynthesis
MRIAVVSIALNEAQFVSRWAESCKEADFRIILDTGSTDETIDAAWGLGVTTHVQEFNPWRFDHARNHAMSIIPEDIDYVIWLDMDEVLQPGWREALEAIPEGVTRPRYKYIWSWNEDGTEGLTYGGDKIHARHGYKWKHPVHEVLKYNGVENPYWVDGLEIHHHPDHTKSRSQYLPLLKLAVEEDPTDDRNQFYLAREYFFHADYGLAQYHFSEHLKLSRWNPERAASHRYMAKMREGAEENHLFKAVAECPDRREAWVELALLYYQRGNWVRCKAACEIALAITEKPLDYLCEAFAWGWMPHDLMAISCFHLGLTDDAFYHGATAASLDPSNERLKGNLTHYRQ